MPQRNAHLDLLRAVAVVMVIVGHCPAPPSEAGVVVVTAMAFFRRYGGLGVDLFFVLSGFLVSGLLFREHLRTGSARVGRFLIRRGFKIYPAFYLFLLITVLLRLRAGDAITRAAVVSESLFVQNYGAHVWSHTWSLAVEEHFYLLLALLVLWLQRRSAVNPFRRVPLIFLVTTVFVGVARVATWKWVPYSTETHRFPTHLEIDSLFFGVLLSF
jgi:peptidoglycan/LPS O-acetylase OafA/YrhL